MLPNPHDRADPPEDPEDWSDEQWLEWLEATDEPAGSGERPATAPGRPRPRGGAMGAAMLGLRDAIYGPPDEQVVIVADAPGGPPGDDHPQVILDPDHPERSRVVSHGRDKTKSPDASPREGKPDTGGS